MKLLSRVQLLATPWTAAYQPPPSIGFSRQEYWSGGAIAFSSLDHRKREFQKNIHFCFIEYTKAFDCVDHNKLWKILKQMRIPDHLSCPLRNLYAGQEATVRTGHGTSNWFQIWKEVSQVYILSPCLLNLYAVYIILNVSQMKQKLE